MLRKFFVIALVAVSLVAATDIKYTTKTADMDMLVKQKKVLDILMYMNTDVLTDSECYEIGRHYDIMSNIDRYTNREVVMDFMLRWKLGMLHKDALFTYHHPEHREEMMLLYHLLYCAKDFTTFYKTACWARMHMNGGLFTCAFTTAIIYRDDTKLIRLPAIYEIYPNLFFDSKVVRDAHRIMMTRGVTHLGHKMGETDIMETDKIFHLQSTWTDTCLNPMYNHENKLAYFMEDVGLNAYYYYVRMMFPFWMNTKEYDVPKTLRGDLYYYIHQQLLARYHLERISNGLGEIEAFTWDRMELPGFHSNIMYPNGLAMPKRDWWNKVPMYKLRYLEYLKKLEIRIMEAIDCGYVIDEMGKQISIMTPEGLNILGNMIEGNHDSINLHYYGAFDVLARNVLGMTDDCKNKDYCIPSSLQLFSSSMKDPAFYRIYNKIVHFFLRYKSLLKHYTKNELEFTGVRIENVEMDKLVTFYDNKDFLINNVVDVTTMKEGKSFNIKAWQYCLNYKPFTYKMSINSDKSTKAVMRIFLGPAVEGEKYDDYTYLRNYYKYFFMLDEFEVNLREGMNNVDRLSTDSVLFKKEHLTGDKFYKKIVNAIEGKEPITFTDRMWGFPEHLMLPKGSVDGMRFKLFFYIGPCEESKLIELPIIGKRMWYGKSLGFPLDRPMQPWFLQLDNIYLKDVHIYHHVDSKMMGERSINRMMDYERTMRMDHHNHNMMHMHDYKHVSRDDMMQGTNVGDYERMGRMHDINMMHI